MSSKNRSEVYVGLVHWPIIDKAGNTVVTNVTNFDIHDIARACRTFGVKKYYIINKLQEQLITVARIIDHWKVGRGSELNPMRQTALGMVELKETVEDVLRDFDEPPLVISTAARDFDQFETFSYGQLRERIFHESGGRPILLLFGTGFGLHDSVLENCDGLLAPIKGSSADDYRHLSVRSAVSIILDRLLGA